MSAVISMVGLQSMASKRTTKPEPKAGDEKYGTLKELRQATLAYCEAWWEWRWGETYSKTAAGLDFSRRRANWAEVKKVEDEARSAQSQLMVYIREALVVAHQADKSPYAGFHCRELKRAAPHLKAALKAMSKGSAWVTQMPVVEPMRYEWLARIVAPRYTGRQPGQVARIEEMAVAELAIYAIIAGFWPGAVHEPRAHEEESPLQIGKGISVKRVLYEERKNIRTAHKKLVEGRKADAAAIEARLRSDGKA